MMRKIHSLRNSDVNALRRRIKTSTGAQRGGSVMYQGMIDVRVISFAGALTAVSPFSSDVCSVAVCRADQLKWRAVSFVEDRGVTSAAGATMLCRWQFQYYSRTQADWQWRKETCSKTYNMVPRLQQQGCSIQSIKKTRRLPLLITRYYTLRLRFIIGTSVPLSAAAVDVNWQCQWRCTMNNIFCCTPYSLYTEPLLITMRIPCMMATQNAANRLSRQYDSRIMYCSSWKVENDWCVYK